MPLSLLLIEIKLQLSQKGLIGTYVVLSEVSEEALI
jgi:hypothetical protein